MKKWFIKFTAILISLLSATAAITIIIDPFFHYHKPLEGTFVYYNREPYQNPGILQHFDYDTVMLGSSMSENFKTSLFREYLGENVVKTSHQAAGTYNLWQYATIALEANQKLDKIYWGIDTWAAEYNPSYSFDPVPEYLVDNNPFNDGKYLWNRDVFEAYNSVILTMTIKGVSNADNMDATWNWSSARFFSQQEALKTKTEVNASSQYSFDERQEHYEENFEGYILSLVRDNPNDKFVFWYPPYSIRFWKETSDNGLLDERLERCKKMTGKLLQYENVEVYGFQNDESIITNLYLYTDVVHYAQSVNDYMTECFATGEHRLTLDNYEREIDKIKEIVDTFDYNQYDNEFMHCDDLQFYINLCNSGEYTLYVTSKNDQALNEAVVDTMAGVGYRMDVTDGAASYGIIEDGIVIQQEFDKESIQTSFRYNQQEVVIDMSQVHCIAIDGVNYGYAIDGMNLVVWDKNRRCVLDSINVNLSSGEITHY